MTKRRIISNYIDSNVFVVSENNSCIIIDAAVEVEAIKKEIAGKKVEAILLTHGHYDHCLFALDYAKEFGCKIYCSEKAPYYLQNSTFNYSEGHFLISDFSKFCFLKDGGELKLGAFIIQYQQLGGHSLSDMGFVIGEEIFVGDVLIGRDMGRIDLYGSDKDAMKQSLEFLLNQNYSTMNSGHGQENNKITQDKIAKLWIKYLNR